MKFRRQIKLMTMVHLSRSNMKVEVGSKKLTVARWLGQGFEDFFFLIVPPRDTMLGFS